MWALGLKPLGPALGLVAFVVGVMVLFRKSFFQLRIPLLVSGFSDVVAHVIAKFVSNT